MLQLTKKNYILIMISFLNGLVFFAPVALLIRTTRGITISQFFILQAVLSLGIFLFEVPLGIVTDHIGYKKSLILSQLLLFLARVTFLFADNFFYFAFEAVIEAISACFISGTKEAYLYSLFEKDEFTKQSSLVSNGGTLGFILSTLSYPVIHKYFGLNGLVLSTVLASSIAMILALGLPSIQSHRSKSSSLKLNGLIFFSKNILFISLINTIINLAFIMISFFYITKLESIHMAIEAISLVILGYSAIQLTTPRLISLLEKYNKFSLPFLSCMNAIIFLLIYSINNDFVLLFMFLAPTTMNLISIALGKIENQFIDQIKFEDKRATLISIFNMGSNLTEIIFLLGSALIKDNSGNICFLIIALLLILSSFIVKYIHTVSLKKDLLTDH